MFKTDSERDRLVNDKTGQHFGDSVLKTDMEGDMVCLTIRKEIIPEFLTFLRDEEDLQYNFLTTLCGMHYPEREELGVVYHLHSFVHNHRIRIKTSTQIGNPVIPSITAIWPAAGWMERETYDFFGIKFEGHPNLKRILNVDEMADFPMRKDFPLEDQTREDKDDSMFGR
jgi:NADH-quinone oxidoreductase subunit C